ncbi:MAG: hypothetical protein N2999_05325 [Proteobacteria bacterium]|nr:hypothetical protein [Pseudomonadota bacterium]
MKNFFMMLLAITLITGSAFAQHGHSSAGKEGHGSSSLGKSIFKGESKGVKVEGWLNDIESAMKAMMKDSGMKIDKSKMDPNLTHHISFMISTDDKAGKIKDAKLKISYKEGSKEYTLMSMQGHYGSDISLKEKGSYKATLIVNTEKSGTIQFNFNIKNQ